ncbi:MAG: hypothetical protein ACQESG_01030, partial [Nanobdellota archaeon]
TQFKIIGGKTGDLKVGIFAIEGLLQSQYSPSQISLLEDKIDDFIEALGRDNLPAEFWYLDGLKVNDLVGTSTPSSPSSTQINDVIWEVWQEAGLEYLIFVGGDRTFPMAQVNADGLQKTDNTYADNETETDPEGVPVADIAYGRIIDSIDGGNEGISLMTKQLDTFIALHDIGGVDLSNYHGTGLTIHYKHPADTITSLICMMDRAFGDKFTNAIYLDDSGPCHFAGADNSGLYIWLTHGNGASSQRFSCSPVECGCYTGGFGELSPSDVIAAGDLSGAVWLMMPCLASKIDNKQTIGSSMPMQFLMEEGAAYVGSTNNARGGNIYPGQDLSAVDCDAAPATQVGGIYARIIQKMAKGKRIGDAYIEGKKQYQDDYTGIGADYEEVIKVFYGDPTLNITEVW